MLPSKSRERVVYNETTDANNEFSSDAYFMHHTIPEVNSLYSKLLANSDVQRKELRSRIGSHYGDVIEATKHLQEMLSMADRIGHSWDVFIDMLNNLSKTSHPSSLSIGYNRWEDENFLNKVNQSQNFRLFSYQLYALKTLPEKIYRWITIDGKYMNGCLLSIMISAIRDLNPLGEIDLSPISAKWIKESENFVENFWTCQLNQTWLSSIKDGLENILASDEKSSEDLVWTAICSMIFTKHENLGDLWDSVLGLRIKKIFEDFSQNYLKRNEHGSSVVDVILEKLLRRIMVSINQCYDVSEKISDAILELKRLWDPVYWKEHFRGHLDHRIFFLINKMKIFSHFSIFDSLNWALFSSVPRALFRDWLNKSRLMASEKIFHYLRMYHIDVGWFDQARKDLMNLSKRNSHISREWMHLSRRCLDDGQDHQSLWLFFIEEPFRQHAELLIEKYSKTDEIRKLLADIGSYSTASIQKELQLQVSEQDHHFFTETSIRSINIWINSLYNITYRLQKLAPHTNERPGIMESSLSYFQESSNHLIANCYRHSLQWATSYEKALSLKLLAEIQLWAGDLIQTLDQKQAFCHPSSKALQTLWNLKFIARLIFECPVIKYIIHLDSIPTSNQDDNVPRSLALYELFETAYVNWLTVYLKLVLFAQVKYHEEDVKFDDGMQYLRPILRRSIMASSNIIDRYESIEISEFLKSLLDNITCLLRCDLGETPFVQRTQEVVSEHFGPAILQFYQLALKRSSTEYIHAIIYHDLSLLTEAFPSMELETLRKECSLKLDPVNLAVLDRKRAQEKLHIGDKIGITKNEGATLVVYNPLIYSLFFQHALSGNRRISGKIVSTLVDQVREDDRTYSLNFPLVPIEPDDDSEIEDMGVDSYREEVLQLPPLQFTSSASYEQRNHMNRIREMGNDPFRSIAKDITQKSWDFVGQVGQKAAGSSLLSGAAELFSAFNQVRSGNSSSRELFDQVSSILADREQL